MRFGKMRIENDEVKFNRMMTSNVIPCCDLIWAYCKKGEKTHSNGNGTLAVYFVVIHTRRQKTYQFEMTMDEATACLNYLKMCNPKLLLGSPNGGSLPTRSAFNIRDLGGLHTRDGRYIMPGRLLHGDDLYHLSQYDVLLLWEDYHVRTVIDFRTVSEQKKRPDVEIEGVSRISNPLVEDADWPFPRSIELLDIVENFADNPETVMMHLYQQFVLNYDSQNELARFFQILIHNNPENGVLWHSAFGKDRSGIASALLLSALGVSRKQIVSEYMKSDNCLQEEIAYLSRLLKLRDASLKAEENLLTVMNPRESYLKSAFNAIDTHYESMERYLRHAMCLSAENLNKLKEKYLIY